MELKLKGQYNSWNTQKQIITESFENERVYFNEGEVWWCSLGLNIGNLVCKFYP